MTLQESGDGEHKRAKAIESILLESGFADAADTNSSQRNEH